MPASILTNRLRKFIVTGEESSNVHRDHKAIRDRVIAGMYDLHVLSQLWSQKEMDKIFPPLYAQRIPEYYYDPDKYSEEEIVSFLGEDYTNDDLYVELEDGITQVGPSRSYLMGLLPFLLRLLETDETGGKMEQDRDWIAPELNEFEQLLEVAVSGHIRNTKSYSCSVDVSIELSNFEQIG